MNKNIDAIEFNWEALGAVLASLSTDEQVPFFKGFADEMNKYPTHFAKESQLVAIVDTYGKFTEEQKHVYATMGQE